MKPLRGMGWWLRLLAANSLGIYMQSARAFEPQSYETYVSSSVAPVE